MKYAVFILTHGRPDKQITAKTLRKGKYTGKIYFVIDDQDETGEEYKKLYGDKVIVFDKKEWLKKTDTMDTEERMDVVVYARNAVYEIAKNLGYRYFIVLDDDYKNFQHRWTEGEKLLTKEAVNLDKLFDVSFRFLVDTGMKCFGWCQGGDFIGGAESPRVKNRVVRKIMNTYFLDTENPVTFKGTTNEDMVASLYHGQMGDVILSSIDMMIVQERTQKQAGGLTQAYLDYGTYTKSFYALMMNPSCVKIAEMGDPKSGHYRWHHRIAYLNSCPCIISERWRK